MTDKEPANVFTFMIGAAFPADDPVARFLVAAAMMSNDLLRLVDWMLARDDQDNAVLQFSFRLQTALFFEASSFLRATSRRWPDVKKFISQLDQTTRESFDRVVGATDPSSNMFLGDWIKKNRNLTFHYAEMPPERPANRDPLTNALQRCSDVDGQISVGSGQYLRSVRFGFADTVAVQWLPDIEDPGISIEQVRERVADLVELTHVMIARFIGSKSRPSASASR